MLQKSERAAHPPASERSPVVSAPAQEKAKVVSREAIARRAYEKFLARASAHGSDREDWLEAERELNETLAKSGLAPPRAKTPSS